MDKKYAPCIVIPSFNHANALRPTLQRLLSHGLNCIVVDDGSTDGTWALLEELQRNNALLTPVRRLINGGKGAAMQDGVSCALKLGYTHVLQIDADGQHDSDEIPRFLEASRKNPDALILGYPVFDNSAPLARKLGREISNVLVWLQTLSLSPRDALCGFRIYPLKDLEDVILRKIRGRRMEFDIEVLVRSIWSGTRVINLPARVTYPIDGISHFRYLKDNLMIASIHVRLILGMIVRSPVLLARKYTSAVSQ